MGDDAAIGVGTTSLNSVEKKRRLSVEQVKTLEKNFEVENKLEPERKVKLAQDLGLQPRQVAVWFQNRRARWKTKQLERDYGVLKANYDTIKNNYDKLVQEKDHLLAELKELKTKLDGKNSHCLIKEEIVAHEDEYDVKVNKDEMNLHRRSKDVDENENDEDDAEKHILAVLYNYKDGLSDSDSSAILNDLSSHSDEGLPNKIHNYDHDEEQKQLLLADFNYTSSSSTCSQFPHHTVGNGRDDGLSYYHYQLPAHQYQQILPKMEENTFLNGNEFFSDDPSPELLSNWWE